MKRTKIMLSAIIVLTVVSSALAFTPKKGTNFCVAATSGGTCALITDKQTTTTTTVAEVYQDLDFGIACNSSDVCDQPVRLIAE